MVHHKAETLTLGGDKAEQRVREAPHSKRELLMRSDTEDICRESQKMSSLRDKSCPSNGRQSVGDGMGMRSPLYMYHSRLNPSGSSRLIQSV